MSARQAARRGRPAVTAPAMSEEESRAWAAATAVLDRVASEMERKWGVGRLQTLVAPDLAARFARAEEQCDEAISSGDVALATSKAAAVARGWYALDAAARDAGHKPNDVGKVWCVSMPERAYVVCLTNSDVGAAGAQYPGHTAVSVQELLRLLQATEAGMFLSAIKGNFPGATLDAIRPPPTKPAPDWSKGDEIPW